MQKKVKAKIGDIVLCEVVPLGMCLCKITKDKCCDYEGVIIDTKVEYKGKARHWSWWIKKIYRVVERGGTR